MDARKRDKVLRLHSDRHRALETVRDRLVAYLNHECLGLSEQDEDFHHRLVEARVKEPSSVIRALDEDGLGPDRMWSDVNDLIGARVVVVTKRMAEKLRDRLAQIKAGPFEARVVKDMDIPERGYRAIHLKGKYNARDGDIGWC